MEKVQSIRVPLYVSENLGKVKRAFSALQSVLGREPRIDEIADYLSIPVGQVQGYRRLILTLPVLSPRLSSYWLYFVTSTSFLLAKSLVESMRNEVICQHFGIDNITQVEKIPYTEAIRLAFSEIEQNEKDQVCFH